MSDSDDIDDNDLGNGDQGNDDLGHGLDVLEAKPKLKRPSMYQVILVNDDFTPMDFVIEILVQFFYMGSEKATQVMLQIHTEGKGSCGVFTVDVAETKVKLVNEYSKLSQHPLLCISEKMD